MILITMLGRFVGIFILPCILTIFRRGLNCSLSVVCDASETLQNKGFLKQNLIELGATNRGAKIVEPASVSEASIQRGY